MRTASASPARASRPASTRPDRAPGPAPARAAPISARHIAAALACAALAFWVYRRALGAYFTTDDFILLEQARGLLASQSGPWRWISNHAYFAALTPLAGASAFPYHLVNWLLHGLNAALLFTWLSRRGMRPAFAVLAAGLFAASRVHVLAVTPVSGNCDLLALTFALGALLTADLAGRAGLGATVVLFAAALLSKENVALLPAVLLLPVVSSHRRDVVTSPIAPQTNPAGRDRPPTPPSHRLGALTLPASAARGLILLGLSAAFALTLMLTQVRSGNLGGSAYAIGFSGNLVRNLSLYSRWLTDLRSIAPDTTTPNPAAAGLSPLLLPIALAALSIVAWRRTRWIALGAAWWLLTLLPVLPLRGHAYLHYLYTPSAGLAIALAGTLAWMVESAGAGLRAGAIAAWAMACAILVTFAVTTDRALTTRAESRMPGLALPADPYFRKCAAARNAIADLAPVLAGRSHVRMLVYEPPGPLITLDATTGAPMDAPRAEGRQYLLLESVLDGGRAVRLVYPQVDTVAFAPRWNPAYASFDLFTYGADGHFVALGSGVAGQVELLRMLVYFKHWDVAREQLAIARAYYSDDSALRDFDSINHSLDGRERAAYAPARGTPPSSQRNSSTH